MKQNTEIHQWQVFELSEDEFREKLGIPPGLHIVSVSTIGRQITIHTTER